MDYKVVVLLFEEDGSVTTYRLAKSFPSPEAAKEAGAHELANRGTHTGEMGFQVLDANERMVYSAPAQTP
jgi:hypothetical protein